VAILGGMSPSGRNAASRQPLALAADERGRVREVPGRAAAVRVGARIRRLDANELIPLPPGAGLLLMPGRRALGFRRGADVPDLLDGQAVAAFVPPGHLVTSLAAGRAGDDAPLLPLHTYAAVAWWRGRLQVAARRVDSDPRHDPDRFDPERVRRAVERGLRRFGGNRLMVHHGRNCALRYACPNARNLFLRRWEAPAAVSAECNTACLGCISHQPASGPPSAQPRLDFVPEAGEIVELGLWHLERAPAAMLSFGQGCEGEPLCRAGLIAEAVNAIRKRCQRGTIHLNSNGTLPQALERCIDAGLDSLRVSLPAARREYFSAYRQQVGPGLETVRQSLRLARRRGLFVSLNLLAFPGVSDDPREVEALEQLLDECRPDMIQWRNLNIDPDFYLEHLARHGLSAATQPLGMLALLERLHRRYPRLRQGSFNPPLGKRQTTPE